MSADQPAMLSEPPGMRLSCKLISLRVKHGAPVVVICGWWGGSVPVWFLGFCLVRVDEFDAPLL